MDLRSLMEVGEKLEIVLEREYFEDLKGFSMVQDIRSKDELTITLPTYEGHPIPISSRDRVYIFFFREEGSYRFQGDVSGRYRAENVVVINIKRVSPVKRIQRRDFYRLKALLPVKLRVLDEEESTPIPTLDGHCIDISGGGIKVNIDQKLGVGTGIECTISLGEEGNIQVTGEVVRAVLTDDLVYSYALGISFSNIEERTRDVLIKYIFKKQRELRRKGFL